MKMIPSTPYQTNSKAEKWVFDWLRSIDQDFHVYHSLNLPSHPYKRFAECDFLVVGTRGLFVLEIKGGGVSHDDKGWKFSGSLGEGTSSEGPFKQAESALHALRNILKKKFGGRSSAFTIGYGVITPQCDIPPSIEWAPATYAGKEQCRSFERWFDGFVRYWGSKKNNQNMVSEDFVGEVNHFLRPDFDVMTPLYLQAQAAEDEIYSLTEGQLNLVDAVEDNPRVLCPGSAGTGKTLLALELAKRWSSGGSTVLVLCYSPWLKSYLQTRINLPGVVVSTIKGMQTTLLREGIKQFNSLIVDEGQDLIRFDDLDSIGTKIGGGLENGRWCFFYDLNNQSNLFKPIDMDAIDLLHSYQPAIVTLKRNCRNTQPILKRIQHDLHVDLNIGGAGAGPEVKSVTVQSDQEGISHLQQWIEELLEGGLSWGDITILSSQPIRRSSASLLGQRYRKHLQELDEYSMSQFPSKKMSFAKIPDFKGLENKAILIVDLQAPSSEDDSVQQAQHYVAMSRASIILRMVYKKK